MCITCENAVCSFCELSLFCVKYGDKSGFGVLLTHIFLMLGYTSVCK